MSIPKTKPLAVFFICVAGCFAGESADVSINAVADFRVRYYEKAFVQMYRSAAPEFQKATTPEDWNRLMVVMSSRLGQVRSASDPAWQVSATTNGTFVRLQYETEFEKGKGTETFVWRVEEERAQLMGYNINSLALLRE